MSLKQKFEFIIPKTCNLNIMICNEKNKVIYSEVSSLLEVGTVYNMLAQCFNCVRVYLVFITTAQHKRNAWNHLSCKE